MTETLVTVVGARAAVVGVVVTGATTGVVAVVVVTGVVAVVAIDKGSAGTGVCSMGCIGIGDDTWNKVLNY